MLDTIFASLQARSACVSRACQMKPYCLVPHIKSILKLEKDKGLVELE